jgi:hypothetical protein
VGNFPQRAHLRPQCPVIKLAAVGLAGGVIDVLHIGKQRDSGHEA